MIWKSLVQEMGPGNGYQSKRGFAFAFFPHRAEDGKTYWLERVPVIFFYGVLSQRWIVKRWLGGKEVVIQ